MSNEAFAKIEAGQKLLTFAPLLAILRAGTLERSFAGRRPGRPCIDEQVQAVIRRTAMENRLWGAPRIHGKLLKLGTPSQKRTVSRYLPDRRRAPSQAWRAYLANHLSDLACTSTWCHWYQPGDDASWTRMVVPRRARPAAEIAIGTSESSL
jgi:hypothetical protein